MSIASPASFEPLRHDDTDAPYREPLSPWMRRGLLAAVIFFHVGAGWALTQIQPTKIVVGDTPPMEVRMVSEEQPPQAAPPPPEEPPPPPPELESMIQPPPPDLPPPVFPIQAPPPPPPKPRPPPPRPQVPQTATPAPVTPQPVAPAAPAAPKTVSASQVSFLVRPNPVYPARSRRANEQGVATIRVLIDPAGRPTQASLQASSGHTALDEAALDAVKAAQFHPYSEGGVPQSVWVLVPIKFVLQ